MQFCNKEHNFIAFCEIFMRKACMAENFMSIMDIEFSKTSDLQSKPCLKIQAGFVF